MAKVRGPLFSLGASGQLAKTLVYLSWKGLDTVREYVIPASNHPGRSHVWIQRLCQKLD